MSSRLHPQGGDLSRYRRAQLATIAEMLNERPRKTLAWRSPAEAYAELLCTDGNERLASVLYADGHREVYTIGEKGLHLAR